jgi:protein O-GlcNAc transferase
MNPSQAYEAALKEQRAGRLAEAERLCHRVLEMQPDHSEALHMLGMLAFQAGHPQTGIDLIRRAIAISPNAAKYHVNLGSMLIPLGRLDEAISAYRRAIELRAGVPEVYTNLGNALAGKGQADLAIASFQEALRLRPDFPEALFNLSNVYHDLGRFEEAIDCCRRAIALRPAWCPAYNNLGLSLRAAGRPSEAIAAFRQGLAISPGDSETHKNLGDTLHVTGDIDAAIACFEKTLQSRPGFLEALVSMGNAFKDSGRIGQAIGCYERALAIDPNCMLADANRVYVLSLHPDYDGQALLREQRLWERRQASRFKASARAHGNVRSLERRLKIGYVSPDFRDHVVARNVVPLFRERDRGQFEAICYASVARPDAMTDKFRSLADGWRDIARMDDQAAADLVRADGIDILVDLSLHTGGNRLLVLARKPAPVQVIFAGYPGGTGLTTIDWRLTDPYLDPPGIGDADYVERSYRLPDSFWCYDPESMNWEADPNAPPAPQPGPPPALSNGYITFGCLNNFSKVNDGVLQLWGRVLQGVISSRLLVMTPPGESRRRVLDCMARFGVEAGRVEFTAYQPRRAYLAEFNRIDLGLDTFPYNGHTSSLDAAWMGVPVISRIGRTAVGRGGLSLLSNLRLGELAADDDERFVKIAMLWAEDLPRLAELRRTLRQRMLASPLTDGRRFTRNVETAYRAMWKAWCEPGAVTTNS